MTIFAKTVLRLMVNILHEVSCINVRQAKQDKLHYVNADFAGYKAASDDVDRLIDEYGEAWIRNNIVEKLQETGLSSDGIDALVRYWVEMVQQGKSAEEIKEALHKQLSPQIKKDPSIAEDILRYCNESVDTPEDRKKLEKQLRRDIDLKIKTSTWVNANPKDAADILFEEMKNEEKGDSNMARKFSGYKLGVTENTRMRDAFDLTLFQGERSTPVGLVLRDKHGYTAVLNDHPSWVFHSHDLIKLLERLEEKTSPLHSGKE